MSAGPLKKSGASGVLGLLRRAQSVCAEHGGGRLRVRELSMATALWGVTSLTVEDSTTGTWKGRCWNIGEAGGRIRLSAFAGVLPTGLRTGCRFFPLTIFQTFGGSMPTGKLE